MMRLGLNWQLALTITLPLTTTLALTALSGCTNVGAQRLQIPMVVQGTAPSVIRVADYEVEVDEARVAFGPFYLCASRLPDVDICPTSVAENLQTTSFDALSETPTMAGTLSGFSQTSRSGMWDYGRSWRISDRVPRPSEQAIEGVHSAIMVLTATHEGETRHFRFVLDVDGGSQTSGTTAVRARLMEQVLTPALAGLEVRFDPTLWASMVDYDTLWELPVSDLIEVPMGHPAETSLRLAMVLNGLPTMTWVSFE